MNDFYITNVVVALLPLAACLVIFQVNPYHALVMRGILGAIAALVYAVLGAADVALTEALVGTMLSITLYAVAVRSSLVMRLGVLSDESRSLANTEGVGGDRLLEQVRNAASKYQMRLELVLYPNLQELQQALMNKEVHTIFLPTDSTSQGPNTSNRHYQAQTRVPRLYEILSEELLAPEATLTYVSPPTKVDEA
jgi:putative multicomponent Na+:H+ antiporter subunit B